MRLLVFKKPEPIIVIEDVFNTFYTYNDSKITTPLNWFNTYGSNDLWYRYYPLSYDFLNNKVLSEYEEILTYE